MFLAKNVDHIVVLTYFEHLSHQLGSDSLPLIIGQYFQSRDIGTEHPIGDSIDKADNFFVIQSYDHMCALLQQSQVFFFSQRANPFLKKPLQITWTNSIHMVDT